MHRTIRLSTLAVLVLGLTVPLGAQGRDGLMGDLIKDVTATEMKIVGLAKVMPASVLEWRPGAGVRSAGETFMHIAADNYFIPAVMGVSAPGETGIDGKDYKTTLAFEKRTRSREEVISELEKSFAFLKDAMAGTSDARLDDSIEVFGDKTTTRGFWILATTHLHEHLGQLIAYARSNNVVPPWSK